MFNLFLFSFFFLIQCDLRVRNMAWEDAFQTNTWEPHDIAEGVKDFLKNLKSFADILHRELLNESEDT